MFYSMVFVVAVSQSVLAGYDYRKPSVPFEFENSLPIQDTGYSGNHEQQKTISYSIRYEDFNYLQQKKMENIIHSGAVNSPQKIPKISLIQDVTSSGPITTELNANIDGPVSVQSAVVRSHVIREPDSTDAQSILSSSNPQSTLTPHIVSPSVNLGTTKPQLLNTRNIQVSNSFKVSNIVQPLFNTDNNVQNLVSVNNNLSPVLNLFGNNVPITNVQNVPPQPPSITNVPHQLYNNNIQNTNLIDIVQDSQVPLNMNYEIPLTTLPLEQTTHPLKNYVPEPINNFYPSLSKGQNKFQPINYQNFESQRHGALDNEGQISNAQNLAKPVITKHIYFHVPPSDIEETPAVRSPTPPKKIYKIVFIKLPAQQSKNTVQLQAALQNQLAPIEHKTLIYVLVKKPEISEIVLPQPKLSQHEVLYVKYKGSPTGTDSHFDDTQVRTRTLENDGLTLQPGRVNGNK